MLSGQVGKTIYQIKNNGDGTFTQIAYNKGERTETRFSPKLQAQRMCMGMVESLMKQLKPIVGISFQSGRNKTTSCNAFSSANLRLVQRDCMEHWYEGNKFVFPYQYKGYPDFSELGGPYMISSGTLKDNLYDELLFDSYAPAQWRDLPYADSALWGLKFNVRVGVDTLEQFRQRHGMTIMDKICFAGFKTWISYDPDPEDPQTLTKHDYFIASFNRSFPSNVVLTPEVLVDLFQFKTNASPAVYISRDNDAICVGCCLDYQHADESYYYWAGFSESHLTGKKQISTSFYGNDTPDGNPYLLERQPSMVFGSWMGEPTVKPYPSPFCTPRIPLGYQEVLYITAVGDVTMLYNITLNMTKMSMEFKISSASTNWGNVIWTKDDIGRFCFISRRVSGNLVYMIRSRDRNGSVDTTVNGSFILNRTYSFLISTDDKGYVITLDGNTEIYPNTGAIIDKDFTQVQLFGSTGYNFKGSLYEILIRDKGSGVVLHDLVPCYRKSDGAIGFYDTCYSYFLTVDDSQTKMTYGPVVNPT